MNKSNFQGIWDLLSKYDLKINVERYSHLTCLLCKNILIDAQKASCGCQYCQRCIEEHLASGNSRCPGNSTYCQMEDFQYIGSIVSDDSVNQEISMIKVTCPEIMCIEEIELRDLAVHLQTCMVVTTKCPFLDLGCEQSNGSGIKLLEHLTDENETHSKLVIEILNNLMNEMKRIRETVSKEINDLKVELKKKDDKINSLQKCYKESFYPLDKKMEENNQMMSKTISKLQDENNMLKLEIKKTKQEIKSVNINLKIAEMKLTSELGLIVWRIDNLTEKKEKNNLVFSDYFYSPVGQKMLLYFYPRGTGKNPHTDQFSIRLCMSNHQSCEENVFFGGVKFEIFDQQTGLEAHQTKMFCSINRGFSSSAFHFPYSLPCPGNIIKNDSILLKCILSND